MTQGSGTQGSGTQRSGPSPNGSQQPPGYPAASWPGGPAAADPTSTNAGYATFDSWPSGYHSASLPANGAALPGEQPGLQNGSGPLPSGPYPTAGYPAPGYPAAGHPVAAYPWHGHPAGGYPGYSAAPGFAMPGLRQRPARPGMATAAGVLGIVHGSLVLLVALLLWALPYLLSLARGGSRGTTELQDLALELFVLSAVTAVCGVVLVVGGILIFLRDRSALIFGAICSLLLTIYWLVRSELGANVLPWPLMFTIIPVIILVQCAGKPVVAWIRWRPV